MPSLFKKEAEERRGLLRVLWGQGRGHRLSEDRALLSESWQ